MGNHYRAAAFLTGSHKVLAATVFIIFISELEENIKSLQFTFVDWGCVHNEGDRSLMQSHLDFWVQKKYIHFNRAKSRIYIQEQRQQAILRRWGLRGTRSHGGNSGEHELQVCHCGQKTW